MLFSLSASIITLLMQLSSSSAGCDAVDSITGLSACETRDIESHAQANRDSISRYSKKSETETEYAAVCVLECFPRHLACGKRDPRDKHYSCLVEATTDGEVGSDASGKAAQ